MGPHVVTPVAVPQPAGRANGRPSDEAADSVSSNAYSLTLTSNAVITDVLTYTDNSFLGSVLRKHRSYSQRVARSPPNALGRLRSHSRRDPRGCSPEPGNSRTDQTRLMGALGM